MLRGRTDAGSSTSTSTELLKHDINASPRSPQQRLSPSRGKGLCSEWLIDWVLVWLATPNPSIFLIMLYAECVCASILCECRVTHCVRVSTMWMPQHTAYNIYAASLAWVFFIIFFSIAYEIGIWKFIFLQFISYKELIIILLNLSCL